MSRISVIKGDITTLDVDVIVNAANRFLAGGGGVDGAIHRAGGPTILQECQSWVEANGPLPTGQAMLTGAGRLPATYVIHTVGPIWGEHDEATAQELLADCYRNSLRLTVDQGCESVAFPNISTGIYGFPKLLAAESSVRTVSDWADSKPEPGRIIFVCFDEENRSIYSDLLAD